MHDSVGVPFKLFVLPAACWSVGYCIYCTWLLRGSISNPYGHPFPKLGTRDPQSKRDRQTVPDTTVVCIDSLRDHTIALSNSTIVDRGTPSPKRVVKN